MTEIITTVHAPSAIGPYSQAVKAGQFLFISGQLPVDPLSGELAGEQPEQQIRAVMDNLGAILAAAGATFAAVVKTTIFTTDLEWFTEINRVYGEYFEADYPARSTIGVAALPKNAKVEIEMIAHLA